MVWFGRRVYNVLSFLAHYQNYENILINAFTFLFALHDASHAKCCLIG